MKEIKILYLYPDILDLYGDIGNIRVLKYRLEKRGIQPLIDTYSIGDKAPDFSSYDIAIRIKTSGFDAKKIIPCLTIEEAVKELYKTSGKKYVIANYTSVQNTRHEIIKYKEISEK